MDLRRLQALVAIADHGSFSAAATALHTVQSNVSSHIAQLERELEVQLVDRRAGVLTEEGAAVVERARRVNAELEALHSDLAALRHEVLGTVRLGMIGTIARWLAPLLLDRLAADHPGVRLLLGDGTTTALELAVASGALDLAVVHLPRLESYLDERPLFDEDLVLVVPADHPLAGRDDVDLTDLPGLGLLMPAPGTTFRVALDRATQALGVELDAKAELDGVRLIASLAFRGYGPAILPATAAVDAGDELAIVRVSRLPRRQVGLVLRRRSRPSAPARALLTIMDELVEARVEEMYGLHPPAPATLAGEAGAGSGVAG